MEGVEHTVVTPGINQCVIVILHDGRGGVDNIADFPYVFIGG